MMKAHPPKVLNESSPGHVVRQRSYAFDECRAISTFHILHHHTQVLLKTKWHKQLEFCKAEGTWSEVHGGGSAVTSRDDNEQSTVLFARHVILLMGSKVAGQRSTSGSRCG